MKISVTGSEGFFGGCLCKLMAMKEESKYDILNGHDITDQKCQEEIAKTSDVIIHLAAVSGIKACDENKEYSEKLNTTATIQLAEKHKKAGGKRFLFASSSAVYGEACDFNMSETHPTLPRSFYGETKLKAEKIFDLAERKYEVLIFRQSNLYGFGLKWKGITVIDQFIERYLAKLPMQITGNGSQKRDFVHVMDVMALYAKVARSSKARSGIYNIGGKESFSMRALAEIVNEIGESIFGYRVPIEFKPTTDEVIWHDFRYDWTKARLEFQYDPKFTVDDYLKERMMIHLRNDIQKSAQ